MNAQKRFGPGRDRPARRAAEGTSFCSPLALPRTRPETRDTWRRRLRGVSVRKERGQRPPRPSKRSGPEREPDVVPKRWAGERAEPTGGRQRGMDTHGPGRAGPTRSERCGRRLPPAPRAQKALVVPRRTAVVAPHRAVPSGAGSVSVSRRAQRRPYRELSERAKRSGPDLRDRSSAGSGILWAQRYCSQFPKATVTTFQTATPASSARAGPVVWKL